MKEQDFIKLRKIVRRFSGKKILILGDLILDEFIWGKVSRISPEAPVPVVWAGKESFMPGGAANVANNVHTLGAETYIVDVCGSDDSGTILKSELEMKGINTDGVITDITRPTTKKTRVIASQQQVVRIDREEIDFIKDSVVRKISDYVRRVIKSVDALIIEDYGRPSTPVAYRLNLPITPVPPRVFQFIRAPVPVRYMGVIVTINRN